MPGYLHNVAARVAGISPAIRPRLPSRFEPHEKGVAVRAAQSSLPQESEELLTPPGPPTLNELPKPIPSELFELPPLSPHQAPQPERLRPESKPFLESPTLPPSVQVTEVPIAPARRRVVVPKPEAALEVGEANESHSPRLAVKTTKATHSVDPSLAASEPAHETSTREELTTRPGLRSYRTQNPVSTEPGIRPADVIFPSKQDHREPSALRERALGAYTLPPSPLQTEMRIEAQHTPPGDVHIVIGKLTIQALFPPQNPITPATPVRTGPKLTLEQYLRQREGRA